MTSVNATDGGMTADEATAYLGYRTRAVLNQAVRRGIAPAHRLGASAFVRRSELDAELRHSPLCCRSGESTRVDTN